MKSLDDLIEYAKKDDDVIAVMLFGSASRNEPHNDIDIALVLKNTENASKKRLAYLKEFDFDIHIYQQLPLYIQTRVLKEGKILHCKDEDMLYDIAYATIKEFNLFEPKYKDYLEGIVNGY